MFIRLSKLLMGKHALTGKAEQAGEAHALHCGPWRQAKALADKIACSTHDPAGSACNTCSDGKSALRATANRSSYRQERLFIQSSVTRLG
ncbi:hypothetical protein PSCICO_24970 [Pseudomonas cichorii]|nr:hypothetical protein PSCICN_51020 [Pseudomonas cichorii]GFM87098.1 hypothetical protein PSCICO_24970 [Pseudomonas cichorii]